MIASYISTSLTLLLGLLLFTAPNTAEGRKLLLVQGAPGDEEYGQKFETWTAQWQAAGAAAGMTVDAIGREPVAEPSTRDRDLLQKFLSDEPKEGKEELWLVLVGHGTYDGKEARFNLRGSDVTLAELGEWLKPFRRPLILIDLSAASGPLAAAAAGPDRVIVTATKSGRETNFARLGEPLVAMLASPEADLDRDGQTSLLEAFRAAAGKTEEFYTIEQRVPTEHALLEDSGDGQGTTAARFDRDTRKATNEPLDDGALAARVIFAPSAQEQAISPQDRARREGIERRLETLNEKKDRLETDRYYRELEGILLELARLNDELERGSGSGR